MKTFLYLVQKNGGKIETNDICGIYPRHKCEGVEKYQKKIHAVLGTPDKSKI